LKIDCASENGTLFSWFYKVPLKVNGVLIANDVDKRMIGIKHPRLRGPASRASHNRL